MKETNDTLPRAAKTRLKIVSFRIGISSSPGGGSDVRTPASRAKTRRPCDGRSCRRYATPSSTFCRAANVAHHGSVLQQLLVLHCWHARVRSHQDAAPHSCSLLARLHPVAGGLLPRGPRPTARLAHRLHDDCAGWEHASPTASACPG